MKVIYYYYYLFYKQIIKLNDPDIMAILAISFCMTSFVIFSVDTLGVILTCNFINSKLTMILTLTVITIFNLFILFNKEKRKSIILSKPKLLKSNIVSIILSFSFFCSTISLWFWVTDVLIVYMRSCN